MGGENGMFCPFEGFKIPNRGEVPWNILSYKEEFREKGAMEYSNTSHIYFTNLTFNTETN